MTTAVKIENLTKIYGSRSATDKAKKMLEAGKSKEDIVKQTGATVGVHNANIEINQGETFVIMGLSGSGKSTMLRMINRLIEPTAGKISIFGEPVTGTSKEKLRQIRREKVSMVFQNFALFPHQTILENTEFGLEIQGVGKAERQKAAEKALENSGLLTFKDQYPNQLSGGMQQRVGLARALANDPEILLMDEAFSALDPLIRRDMQDELVELQEKLNKTIVFITHDLDEALRIGDRIALMKDGEVVQIGTGEEILTNPANDYVERFIENVDRSKVLTAEHAMEKPKFLLNVERQGARMALRRMEEENYTFLMVINNKRKLLGYIRGTDVAAYIKKNRNQEQLSVASLIRTDQPVVAPDTSINDIYDVMGNANMPISVVDEGGHLLGMVSSKMVINSLATDTDDDSGNNNNNNNNHHETVNAPLTAEEEVTNA